MQIEVLDWVKVASGNFNSNILLVPILWPNDKVKLKGELHKYRKIYIKHKQRKL